MPVNAGGDHEGYGQRQSSSVVGIDRLGARRWEEKGLAPRSYSPEASCFSGMFAQSLVIEQPVIDSKNNANVTFFVLRDGELCIHCEGKQIWCGPLGQGTLPVSWFGG